VARLIGNNRYRACCKRSRFSRSVKCCSICVCLCVFLCNNSKALGISETKSASLSPWDFGVGCFELVGVELCFFCGDFSRRIKRCSANLVNELVELPNASRVIFERLRSDDGAAITGNWDLESLKYPRCRRIDSNVFDIR